VHLVFSDTLPSVGRLRTVIPAGLVAIDAFYEGLLRGVKVGVLRLTVAL
jgi:hypothetical protein